MAYFRGSCQNQSEEFSETAENSYYSNFSVTCNDFWDGYLAERLCAVYLFVYVGAVEYELRYRANYRMDHIIRVMAVVANDSLALR